MKKAWFFEDKQEHVECGLCMHRCTIKPGRTGKCGVRENRDGTLCSLVYGKVAAQQIDPVEKKPLFHFLPGSLTSSISTVGCNFKCLHCQNHSLSQGVPAAMGRMTKPDEVVRGAVRNNCQSISYTYVEPTVFFEFAYDCCEQAKAEGLRNIFVSNGYMTPEAAQMLAPVLDGINIDVKAFNDDFYKKICGAHVDQVLDNVRYFREAGVWVEVTTLLIPGLNDSDEELRDIANFIVEVDPDIPWHVSAFHPTYKMLDRPPTSPISLIRARDLGMEAGLRYVYIGNVRGSGGENTDCPGCGKTIIRRAGFSVIENLLDGSGCPHCRTSVAGVWG